MQTIIYYNCKETKRYIKWIEIKYINKFTCQKTDNTSRWIAHNAHFTLEISELKFSIGFNEVNNILGGESLAGVSSFRCGNHKAQHLRFGEIRQWKFHLQLSDPYRWQKVKVFVVAFYNFKPCFRQVTDFTAKRCCVFAQDLIVKWFLYL